MTVSPLSTSTSTRGK
uniref:Uncharacterized protein n=1 Tax=Arundo donax TaxID=35708 RepID=A0A0A8ZT83_ARUDO